MERTKWQAAVRSGAKSHEANRNAAAYCGHHFGNCRHAGSATLALIHRKLTSTDLVKKVIGLVLSEHSASPGLLKRLLATPPHIFVLKIARFKKRFQKPKK